MHPLLEALVNLFFPERPGCKLCGSPGEGDLCFACRHELSVWAAKPKCPVCGRPVPLQGRLVTLCRDCRRRPPPFEMARAVGPYEGGLREAIHLLKYKGRKSLAPLLGRLLLETLPKYPPLLNCDLVLPVPLSPGRLRERGFNQAELLAVAVARGLNLPLLSHALMKTAETPPQTGLTRQQREQNLQGSFQVTAPEQIRDKNILIVDDVFTTGSTVSAMAETLRGQGAASIFVITVANAAK
ncbi:ComF family protein [Desulforamulus putei]|uniref:ComF family protein n=1 Tax=Desulforamulus putei DSM 12395 TaxID=1121429 RepID=A0A1M4VC08_9FIRM|nr:ComF family protein [Desulforamulus putei]SHE66472.1 comF family protein [Desulforamulus putei DSM 12395]